MKCSQCGYENKEEEFSRCPRCYKILAAPKDCASCGKCGIFKIRSNCQVNQ